MKQSRKLKSLFEILLVIGAILLIPLFFVIRSQAAPQAVEATPTVVLWPSPSPQGAAVQSGASPTAIPPTAAARGKQPLACTFPLAQTTTVESQPESYTFSEPQVVLTMTMIDERQPDIIEWLPDNQNALIMPSQFIDLGMNGDRQTIELFNPETKEIHIYATRRTVDQAPPAWNSALNAIVYSDMNVLKGSTFKNFKFTRQVRISFGNPDKTQLLADDLPQYHVAVKSDGSQIAYFTEKQLVKLDTSLNITASSAFDRKALDFKRKDPNAIDAVDYKMAWRPNSSQLFVYNWASDNLGYTYIMETNSGQLCSLDFGGWAEMARWSPNGRYLAIVRARGSTGPAISVDVVVLDMTTGASYILDAVAADIEGKHHLAQDVVWAPDNHHLLFAISTTYSPVTYTYNGLLYLSDFISGQVERILPAYQFNIGGARTNLAWSPDGSKLLMNCPAPEGIKQVCLISIRAGGK